MTRHYLEVPIGELTLPVTSCNPSRYKQTSTFKYVDISSIDRETKEINTVSTLDTDAAPSRARQIIRKGDVLVSTVRPNLNAVAVVTTELDAEIASTGFAVLRPDPTKLDWRYLFQWVKHEQFVSHLIQHATGVSYPAVTDKIVKSALIPLPNLEDQKWIAEVLDKADALRQKRRLALQKLDTLLQSVFLEMFGDPATNPKGWDVVPMLSVTREFRYGTSNKSGDRGYPTLRIPNIVNQTLDLAELKTVVVTNDEFGRLKLQNGDVLFVRTNGNPDNVGRCSVFDEREVASTGYPADQFIYASYLIRSRLDLGQIDPFYLQNYLLTKEGRNRLKSKCRTSAGQFNINTEALGNIPILLPPVAKQREFVTAISEIRAIRNKLTRQGEAMEHLFQSLQTRAFKGELFESPLPSVGFAP